VAGKNNEKPLTIARAAQILTDGTRFRHSKDTLFRDFLAIATICFRNFAEPKGPEWDEREAHYHQIIRGYDKDTLHAMSDCIGALILLAKQGYTDLLGELYMNLDIGSKTMGQFFTPFHVSELMAMIMFDRMSVTKTISSQGYIDVNEPTCGAGGMLVAAASTIHRMGFDPRLYMRATAQDIDVACCQMTYLNCVLFGIPATIIHGDVIALEQRSIIKSPALLRIESGDQSQAA
jgi:hypothetical protein